MFSLDWKRSFLKGPQDIYDDGIDKVIHIRTKSIEPFNMFENKLLERKRKEYLYTENIKKSTEILIFTDRYSFS